MSDARLRNAEKRWKESGAPADLDAYLRECARVGTLWDMYSAQFDAALLRPWDSETIEMLVVMAHHLKTNPSTPTKHQVVHKAQDVLAEGYGFESSVIIGNTAEFPEGVFMRARRVLVINGTFVFNAFGHAQDCIVINGIFGQSAFADAKNCVVINGRFALEAFFEARNSLVLGGTYKWQSAFTRNEELIMLGGSFSASPGFTSPFQHAIDIRYWNLIPLPSAMVNIPGINCHFALRGSITGNLPNAAPPIVYTDACMGVHPQGVHHLPPNTLYDLLPLLRADKTVTRHNLREWIDMHFARLAALEVPNCPYQQ